MFGCEGDDLGHTVLGFHDGIDSWTLALESGQGSESQHFVARHERAHHHLHSSTPWGVAMLLAGLPRPGRSGAGDSWRWLGQHCRLAHERYATWQAVAGTANGLDLLRGNYTYLDYNRWVEGFLARVGPLTRPAKEALVEVVFRYAMSPAALLPLDLDALDRMPEPWGHGAWANSPDARLDAVFDLVERPGVGTALVKAITPGQPADAVWDAVRVILDRPGLSSAPTSEVREWTEAVVTEFNDHLTRDEVGARSRVLLEDPSANADRLTSLVDLFQRERLRLHLHPLPLRTHGPEAGRPPVAEFARRDQRLGPYVILAWLLPAFLRKHFTGVPELPGAPRLGLLSVDRRPPSPHALWADLEPVPPALVLGALAEAPLTPLCFMTLRSFQAAADEVDFRGWNDTAILIDSDALVFLQHGVEAEAVLNWSVIGVGGDREVDVMVFQRQGSPSEIFFLPVSNATGRIIGQWMHNRPRHFTQDRSAFDNSRNRVLALVELLLGTLWTIDLHG